MYNIINTYQHLYEASLKKRTKKQRKQRAYGGGRRLHGDVRIVFFLNTDEPLQPTGKQHPQLLWGYGYGLREMDCNDAIDNDADTLVDCEDVEDCSYAQNCEEICDNEVDDDGDFAVDCDDLWCEDDASCL